MEFGAVGESENFYVFVSFRTQIIRFLLNENGEVVFEVFHHVGLVEEKSEHNLVFVHWHTVIQAPLFYHPLHLESLLVV